MKLVTLSLSNVSYAYAGVKNVLDDVSITVPEAKITVVLGKSGSGKSTLLQVINGMIRPDSGYVHINGNLIDYHDVYTLRQRIGYVVQDIGLFPHMTIRANISILGTINRKPAREITDRLHELMEMVRLPEDTLEKYPHELSGGEQQRAGICRALLLKPPLLLMDEPFASLDMLTKQAISEYLIHIQSKEPRTIVMVTHDWSEAKALGDFLIRMDSGRIVATADKAEIDTLQQTYLSGI